MSTSLPSSRLPWVAGSILVLLLCVLAVLQVHWLRQVAEADRQRLEAAVETALGAVAHELDREVSRAWLVFHGPGGVGGEAALRERWERWRETAPSPELVSEVIVVRPAAGEDAELAPTVRRLDADGWVDDPREPPAASDRRRRSRGARGARHRIAEHLHRLRHRSVLRPELPGLELELDAGGTAFVLFDRSHLAGELLPGLVERHLEPVLGAGAEVAVTTRAGEVLYASSSLSDTHAGAAFDWRVPLFDLLPPEDLHRLAFATLVPGSPGPGPAAAGPEEPRRWARRLAASAPPGAPGGWVLAVRPAEGSLDAALARAHRGNAAVAFGILLLLGLAAAALLVSARRARETARRQLELTAGVSHELRTPLAAIRSLADNLADGLVRQPEQARRYGEQIGRQGERLSAMVEQVLALAAQEAGGGERRPVDVAALAREAVAELAAAGGNGGDGPGRIVRLELPDPSPVVTGDRPALLRAVENLLANAFRHGDPPVVLRVTGGGSDGEVRLEVADAGPGVDADERERLFEPFVRGRRARERQLPGSGLGLHLVRRTAAAHGGRVEHAAGEGGGSVFTLVLPAAADGRRRRARAAAS